jgi:ABC-type xylose transport system substrate-binding protein
MVTRNTGGSGISFSHSSPLFSAGTWTASQRFNDNVLLTFGDPDGTDADFFYNGTNMVLDVNSGDLNVVIAGGDMAFQQATTISTSLTTLTLDPATAVIINKPVQIDQTELVISSGAVTVTRGYHSLDGEGNVADDLDTINGGVDGMLLVLRSNNAARDITLTEDGNLKLVSTDEFILTDPKDTIMLIYQGGGSYWQEISRSNNQ